MPRLGPVQSLPMSLSPMSPPVSRSVPLCPALSRSVSPPYLALFSPKQESIMKSEKLIEKEGVSHVTNGIGWYKTPNASGYSISKSSAFCCVSGSRSSAPETSRWRRPQVLRAPWSRGTQAVQSSRFSEGLRRETLNLASFSHSVA